MSNIFFTSDTHFGHKKIISIGRGRPFETVEEHDEGLIENWNSIVKRGDRVYHNGDISFHKPEQTIKILRRLNGQIFVQKGNHDPEDVLNTLLRENLIVGWRDIRDLQVGKGDDKQMIVMSHYPMVTWNRGHYGSWMLHGHSHGNLADDGNTRLDVGVDVWNYHPVSYEQIAQEMKGRTFKAVDHHA